MSNCYSQITLAERRRLFEVKELKVPLGDIARLMGRHLSTIYREIKRNSFRDTEIPDYNGYHSVIADNIREDRRTRLRKLRRYPELRKFVIKQLEPHRPVDRAYEVVLRGESFPESRLRHHNRFLFSPDGFALGKGELRRGLDLAELATIDCIQQLDAQFLDYLIYRHLRLLDVFERCQPR